jgi:hypothetical protein
MPVVLKHTRDPLAHRELPAHSEYIPSAFVVVFSLIALAFAYGLLSLRHSQSSIAVSDELSSLSRQADSLDRGY